jgi:radical SAM protein with 4Fe4S-binding SPASM domain
MYFKLNPECYFIKGKTRGAIFDLIEGKIFALNRHETEIITHCERNECVNGGDEFLRDLKQRCLGNFYSKKTYIQKLRIGSPIEKQQIGRPPQLYRAFLEINNSCNRNCWFCGYYGIKRSLGCIGCNKWNGDGESLDIKRWNEIIDELRLLDCRNIYITGGDLTISWDRTIDILNCTTGKFIDIYLIIHRQNLSENVLCDLPKDVKLIIQTENANDIHDDGFTYLLISNPLVKLDPRIILNKNILLDYVIDDVNYVTSDLPIMSKSKIHSQSIYQFLNNIEYHPCLGHTLAICYNGDVIPCPMMRHHVLGNVRLRKLHTIFKNWDAGINKFWTLNLDKIEKCTDCEFRYVCNDCRALEERLTGKLEGKRLCNYDPRKGMWL